MKIGETRAKFQCTFCGDEDSDVKHGFLGGMTCEKCKGKVIIVNYKEEVDLYEEYKWKEIPLMSGLKTLHPDLTSTITLEELVELVKEKINDE